MLRSRGQDVNNDLICAVREGNLERARELIDSFGLSYSPGWSEGYVLLCDALKNKHAAVAKLLLTSGARVNRKSRKRSETPLHFAAIIGDVEIVKMILDKGGNVNAYDPYGRSPLYNAIQKEKIEVAELLLKHRADVNAIDNDGESPLHVASMMGCLQIVELLLECGAYVNCVCSSIQNKGYSPLHLAVEKGSREVTMLLLNRGANVDAKAENNITPLHIAAKKGYMCIAEDLLNHGACIHSLTLQEEYTPLHLASEQGNEDVVKLFLNRGANVDANAENNKTSLHIAAEKGYMCIAEDLLNHGACPHSLALKKKYTPLHFASEQGNEDVVKLLLNRGANVDASTKRNLTPLHIAVKTRHETIVKLLLQHGAKVDMEDKKSRTILRVAVAMGYSTVVKDILRYCPDINNQSNRSSLIIAILSYGEEYKKIVEALLEYGFTANPEDANDSVLLHNAVKNGYLEIVRDLLKYGANVNTSYTSRFSMFKKGFTPLHNAAQNKQEEIAKLLVSYEADINAQDGTGKTPILYAIESADLNITRLLLTSGANVNAQDKTGKTPIFYAIERADLNITRLLLTSGANVKDNPELLNRAVMMGCIEIVEALLQHGADINASDKHGSTALHFSASGNSEGFVEIAELLLSKGANIDAQTKKGLTPVHIASQKGHSKVVAALLNYGCDINIMSRDNCTPLDDVMTRIRLIYNEVNDCAANDDPYYNLDLSNTSYGLTAEALKLHIVKMKTANLYVSERNLLSISTSDEISDFQDVCEEEVARMKSEKISNTNVSFYDILAKSTISLAIYMRNENIVLVLKSEDYKTKFPIYACMIQNNFRKGMQRKELLEKGHLLFNNLPQLPRDCRENIFSYLSDKDLRILIDACKPLSISSTNTNINDWLCSPALIGGKNY